MVDPFFAQQSQSQGATPPPPNPQQAQVLTQQAQAQIQVLLQQQAFLQQQYAQLGQVVQHPQATVQQKQQAQFQAQQINQQYIQISQQLQQLGYTPNRVNKPVVSQVKSGSSVSMKGFLIGCFVLLLVVMGGLVGVFYYLMNNPTQLASVGLDPATTKNLLQVFAVVFFGLLAFLGMGLVIVNAYRLATVKNTSKLGYGVGFFFGFLLLIGSIFIGSKVVTLIKSISVGDANAVDANKIVIPYIYLKKGWVTTASDASLKLIAPSLIAYKLNSEIFNAQVMPSLGQVSFSSGFLDCGNGQQVSLNFTTAQFDGSCIYFKKGAYPLSLSLSYTSVTTSEKGQKTIPAGTLTFDSEIVVKPVDGSVSWNDSHTEMIVGKVPSKVQFDATSVFKDLGLPDYKVVWDVNGDGEADKQDASSFTYVYKEAKLYNVTVRFPGLNSFIYTFPLRVEQSDVPVCEIAVQAKEKNMYDFSANFLESTSKITAYQFDISDTSQKKIVYTTKTTDPRFSYQLPGGGPYVTKMIFMTDDGKKGSCESDDIVVGSQNFDIRYDLRYKSPQSPTFQALPVSGTTSFADGRVVVGELPTMLQLSLTQISPSTPGTTKRVLFDGKPVLSSDDTTFEIRLDTPEDHTLTIVVEDVSRLAKTEKVISLGTKRDSIVGKLFVKPDSVGTDPFTVTLDASTTVVNDPKDELVYFTWDFGDGEIKKNLSQGVVQHTYRYDSSKENGTYTPKVTFTTKKGLIQSTTLSTPIIVKKQQMNLKVNIDTHPGQVANVGERVGFSIEVNGVPKKVYRDFGNTKTLECSGRECVQASTMYQDPGAYTIKVKITYDDKPEVEGKINLKVK